MGLGPETMPALPRSVIMIISRRGVVLMGLMVLLLVAFTMAPTSFLPVTQPGTVSVSSPPPPIRPENPNSNVYDKVYAEKHPGWTTISGPRPGSDPNSSSNSDADAHADSAKAQYSVTSVELPALGTVLPQTLDQPARRPDPICDNFPDTGNILLIVKTGATEAYAKLPTQLLTVLRCLPEYFIFSDMEQTISGYHVRDALDTVLEEAKKDNKDFDLYRRQQKCAVDQDACNKDHIDDAKRKDQDTSNEGWNLDKYKNIHIAEKVYAMRPNYDWYVTVDADTYVLWPTMVQWLRTLDPREQHYLGSVTMLGGFPFGHGGSGYVLSQAAMASYVGKHKGLGNMYDMATKSECCGDYMLARSLKDKTGIDVRQSWPTINGEKPFTIPFGKSQWCHAIATMHHMNSEELSTFWEFENKFYKNRAEVHDKPMLIKHLYHAFFEPRLQELRDNWDNLSDDRLFFNASVPPRGANDRSNGHKGVWQDWQLRKRPKPDKMTEAEQFAWRSPKHCRAACSSHKDCYQWRFQDGVCAFSWTFKLGRPQAADAAGVSTCGWEVGKIRAFIAQEGDCPKVHWPSW